MGKELLTLDAMEPDRDFITINGKQYDLREQDELSLSELARIRRESRTVVDAGSAAEMSEEDAKKFETFLDDIVKTVVIGLEASVIDKLRSAQKIQIVSAFMAVAAQKRAGAVTGKEGSQPTMDGSSRGSEDSTEAASPST
jgi:hypothetical protein